MTSTEGTPPESGPQQIIQPGKKTFVLVHGATLGGWSWKYVAEQLRARGHYVSTPTLTGLGERAHLLSSQITLDTHIADIVGHIESEELEEVILVGHSYGGVIATGVVDRIPARIQHLFLLDGGLLPHDQSAFDALPTDLVAERRAFAQERGGGVVMPPPDIVTFGMPEDHPLAAWVRRRMTPHPLSTYESRLRLAHPIGNGLPVTYVASTKPIYRVNVRTYEYARAQPGWKCREIETGHLSMITAPADVVRLVEMPFET